MDTASRHVVVIGGGISGLSSAFYLHKFSVEQGMDLTISVIERDQHFGGQFMTLHKDGFVIEKGPDSFHAPNESMMELISDLDLEDELVAASSDLDRTYILHRGELQKLPQGISLGIPTHIKPLFKTNLLSFPGKLRAGMDLFIPKRMDDYDESVGSFLERRLGQEVLENIAEPLLTGIYAGDTYKLSLQATFPQFGEIEKTHGSLIRGMKSIAGTRGPLDLSGPSDDVQTSKRLTFRQGMQSIAHSLVHYLHPQVNLIQNTCVTAIERVEKSLEDAEARNTYQIVLDSGKVLSAAAVILTTPTYVASPWLEPYVSTRMLDHVHYISVANIVMGFDAADIPQPLEGSGFLVPRKEKRNITACTWTSNKWPHTTPEGKVMLRLYVGREGDEHNVDLPDEQMIELVRKDLREVLGIEAAPVLTEITRLKDSMPQYPVGHLNALERLREEMAVELPGIEVAGSGYEGVEVPDCVRQGRNAAAKIIQFIQ
ncbi:protoporphyrinogen oxidase [Paenibacillus selenitireducens]|uniref:Coproporphyrinogen III oxidase n=1 Tax=Paenibacillus selenitireducens TaxID=1324314 RepID=A0A1T2XNR8_9BACL|nr:protoporphyrinogen oxidase [Paenibacillus selenitireducens]